MNDETSSAIRPHSIAELGQCTHDHIHEPNDVKSLKKVRNTNIEILRLVLLTAICFWHVIMHGYGFKDIGHEGFCYNGNMGALSFYLALFSPAVYCFMFISGWYGIKFSTRKFGFLAFCGFSCFVLSMLIRYSVGDPATISYMVSHLLPISCGNWWFLTNYALVFLVAPFIDCGLERMDKKTVRTIICIMTFIELLNLLSSTYHLGSNFYGLLYVYTLSRFMRIVGFHCSKRMLLCAYFLSLLLLWGLCYFFSLLPGDGVRLSFRILAYNNPLIIIMAAAIFLIVKDMKPRYCERANTLLSNVLVIYLLTEGIGRRLYQYEASLFNQNFALGMLSVIVSVISCLIIGNCISIFFERLVGLSQKLKQKSH